MNVNRQNKIDASLTVGSSRYRRLARRYAALCIIRAARGLTADEAAELARVSAAMAAAEMQHDKVGA